MYEMAEINDIGCEVQQRWNWLVHILRRKRVNDNCFSALGGHQRFKAWDKHQKTTWRRTIERTRNKAGKSWEAAKTVAWDRKCWWESVMTLCTYWHNEKWWWWWWNLWVWKYSQEQLCQLLCTLLRGQQWLEFLSSIGHIFNTVLSCCTKGCCYNLHVFSEVKLGKNRGTGRNSTYKRLK